MQQEYIELRVATPVGQSSIPRTRDFKFFLHLKQSPRPPTNR